MKLGSRIGKLIDRAKSLVTTKRREASKRLCKGLEWGELLDRVEKALPPGSEALFDGITEQVEAYHAIPPEEIGNGQKRPHVHGFVQWLHGLQDGWASLPETIPLVVIRAYHDGHAAEHAEHAERVAKWGHLPTMGLSPACRTPLPMTRCADCWMVLPEGFLDVPNWKNCPVCGSHRLTVANLARPWGTFHEYDPKRL